MFDHGSVVCEGDGVADLGGGCWPRRPGWSCRLSGHAKPHSGAIGYNRVRHSPRSVIAAFVPSPLLAGPDPRLLQSCPKTRRLGNVCSRSPGPGHLVRLLDVSRRINRDSLGRVSPGIVPTHFRARPARRACPPPLLAASTYSMFKTATPAPCDDADLWRSSTLPAAVQGQIPRTNRVQTIKKEPFLVDGQEVQAGTGIDNRPDAHLSFLCAVVSWLSSPAAPRSSSNAARSTCTSGSSAGSAHATGRSAAAELGAGQSWLATPGTDLSNRI